MRFFLFGLIIVIFSSCLSEPDCLVSASNEVKIVFKKAKKEDLQFVQFPVIESSGTDVLFIADSVSSIKLYVDPRAAETTFRFHQETGTTYSVTFKYDVQNILISPACGAYRYFSGLKVVSYTFSDTVKITNPILSNNKDVKNVEIKF